jgi:glycerol-3-phosphate dehydrogenase
MDLNVLIVGGGIHGVGVLHDLATRGIKGLHLVERKQLASETSSRTTKLIHGGLRYLEHPLQWGLVRDALKERALLLENLPGIVQPLPFVLPTFRNGRAPWRLGLGLRLYDLLASGHQSPNSILPKSRRLKAGELQQLAPYLKRDAVEQEISSAFLYYDAQMLDDVIVRLAARAAQRLDATYTEQTEAEHVEPIAGGFRVRLRSEGGRQDLTCRLLVNAGGSSTSANLLRWGFLPQVTCLLNVGSHLVFAPAAVDANPKQCAATLLQHDDGRVVFFIPWNGKWLFGTTDSTLEGTPGDWDCPRTDRDYLLDIAARYLALDQPLQHITEFFCGIRTIPVSRGGTTTRRPNNHGVPAAWQETPYSSPFYQLKWHGNIPALSREAVIADRTGEPISIYGGKFTTYRSLSERIGDRIATRLGEDARSGTRAKANWFLEDLQAGSDLLHSDPSLRQPGRQLSS